MTTPLPGGRLIAFEGIDGSGKSTQAKLVVAWAEQLGLEVVFTREPTTGPWGMKIRDARFKGRLSPDDQLDAFLNDRREHVETLIRPALARGALVVIDRYYYSTVAYQGARGMDPNALLARNRDFAPRPDLVVLVDVDARVGLERIGSRGAGHDVFENLEVLSRARDLFLSLDEPHVQVFDGTKAPEVLHRDILRALVRGPLAAWAQALVTGPCPPGVDSQVLAALAAVVKDSTSRP